MSEMDACIAYTASGAVRGERGDGVYIWRGLPYAAPPAGEKRFKKPEPAEPWEGIREAVSFGPSCPQTQRTKGREEIKAMDEDCLTLNIWSPAADGEKRAVLFYIHGGSFVEGSGCDAEYEGTNLVRAGDVVLVTINYRLGLFGFMDFSFLGEGFTPNPGLWDIIAALGWVSENIGAFGGDPDNVTLCGQSAGASCVCLLAGADEARGYFRRAIMMSAVPNLLHSKTQAEKIGRSFLRFMGITGAETLMSASAEGMAARQAEFAQQSGLGTTTFAPCLDGALVKQYPISAASEGNMRGVAMLIGTTREEMSFALRKSLSHIVDIENIRKRAVESEQDDVRARIREAYERYGERGPGIMFSDFTFRMPSVWFAEAQSKNADTWMYRFDYETLGMRVSKLHAFHSCDIPFLFGNMRAGLARYMFMLAPDKRGVRELHAEFMGDFLEFMKTGSLPWRRCGGDDVPAKCYGRPSVIEQAVPEDVRKTYDDTGFKKSCISGEGVDFPLNI